MSWRLRSLILRGFAHFPFGHSAYRFLQSRFGAHLDPTHLRRRLAHVAWFAGAARRHGVEVEGAKIMEVGTGWYPMVPLGLWFCGAARVFTFDLNRHLSARVTSRALKWMAANQEELIDIWGEMVPVERIREKLALVDRMKNRPLELLERIGISYLAPEDASLSRLDNHSVDIHFSLYTFEHIPRDDLRAILREAARVLRPGGVAIHRVDPKDHFSGTDPSITKINFLGFTESKWRKHFGHRLAFQNRLHDPEFRALFEESGLRLLECDYKTDERSLAALREGFPLAAPFDRQNHEDLCRYALDYVATARAS